MLFLNNKVANSPLKFDKSLFLMGELNPTMLTIHKGGHDSQPWRLWVFFLKWILHEGSNLSLHLNS
jgi:hypothetical protein